MGGIAGYLRDDAVNNYFAGTVSAFDGAYAGSVFGRTMKTTYINSNKVTLTITNNYTANSTAVGYGGEDGMITQIRPDQITGTGKDSLLARLNSNVDGVNNMIANHKTGLLESEWAEITESIGGVAFRAFHWTAGSHGPVQCLGTLTDCACSTCNQILHDWSNGDGICAVCGTVGCLHEQYVNGFCTGCDSYQSATGSGTQDDPYLIGNAGQLYWFAAVVNEGYGRTAKNRFSRWRWWQGQSQVCKLTPSCSTHFTNG